MTDYLKKFRLDKKIAYVVGGLGLIGKEVSNAYAMAGAKVIILDIAKFDSKKINNNTKSLFYVSFDCSNINKLENNFLKIFDKFQTPDIFINCSYPKTNEWNKSSFNKVTFKSFRKNVDIHMNSYAWLAKLTAERMVQDNKSGSIINLGSIYGILGQDLNIYKNTKLTENMTYSAIKGGIINLTRQMASYYGQFNIRVNSICPGGLESHIPGAQQKQDNNFIKQYIKKSLLKRMCTSQDVASTALFLSSNAASYITGATVMVDGGITAV